MCMWSFLSSSVCVCLCARACVKKMCVCVRACLGHCLLMHCPCRSPQRSRPPSARWFPTFSSPSSRPWKLSQPSATRRPQTVRTMTKKYLFFLPVFVEVAKSLKSSQYSFLCQTSTADWSFAEGTAARRQLWLELVLLPSSRRYRLSFIAGAIKAPSLSWWTH